MAVTINGTTGITTPDIDSVDATFTGTVVGDNSLPDAIDVNASAPADSLAIDSTGRVTMPYQPAFTVSGNNIGWSASLSSGHILELGNVSSYNVFDRGNNYDASNYRFVAPIDGVYLFAANLYGLLSNTEQGYNFTINGTATRGHSSFTIYGAEDATGDLVVNGTALFELSANDWVDIRVNTNGTTWYAPHSWWSGYLVG